MDGEVLGIANYASMCTPSASAVTQDRESSVAFVGTIAAHELGHVFSMSHDDGRKCRNYMFVAIKTLSKFGII